MAGSLGSKPLGGRVRRWPSNSFEFGFEFLAVRRVRSCLCVRSAGFGEVAADGEELLALGHVEPAAMVTSVGLR